MKLIHLSDLHIGKIVNGFSMLEDQQYILTKIINIIDDEHPDAIVIAGDVYDKSVPPAEAVREFDDFLYKLASRKIETFVISGNHDSAERIAFGGRLMDFSGIHMSPVYDGNIRGTVVHGVDGVDVTVYMLPFIKPVHVRKCHEDAEIGSYTDAVRVAIEHMDVDPNVKNVLVTHQFVTGAERSDSETVSVGGTDNVDAGVFEPFDYVALGHIHGPQHIGRETVRYSGTPLKYSFSEVNHNKSVTVVEIADTVTVRTVPLIPKRDMREIRGLYDDLMHEAHHDDKSHEDYIHVTLLDEEDQFDALNKLRNVYPNIMKLDYDNTRTRTNTHVTEAADVDNKSPMELLEDLYEIMNGQSMNDDQIKFAEGLFEEIMEG